MEPSLQALGAVMNATPSAVVTGLNFPGRKSLFYYPACNVLARDGADRELLKAGDEFKEALFLFFRGVRRLRAVRESLQHPTFLYVEPWRTCNLSCTYCYAGAGPAFHKRLSLDKVKSLVRRNGFKDVMVYGGDPLVDKSYLASLLNLTHWDSFFFSTNGALMNECFQQELRRAPNASLQISVEPQEWENRVNSAGRRGIDLVLPKLNLFAGTNYGFRLVIPSSSPYVPLEGFIQTLEESVGNSNFSVCYWPAYEKHLPQWIGRWIDESLSLMRSDPKRFEGKLPGESVATQVMRGGRFFRYFYCNAAYGSVAVGPDGLLHACHHNAILEDDRDVVSRDNDSESVDPTKTLRLAHAWTTNMNSAVCSDCSARYFCGGGCFQSSPPSAECEFREAFLPLALTNMTVYDGLVVDKLASRSRSMFWAIYSKREELEKEVRSQEWRDMVSGAMPSSEVAAMAGQFDGLL